MGSEEWTRPATTCPTDCCSCTHSLPPRRPVDTLSPLHHLFHSDSRIMSSGGYPADFFDDEQSPDEYEECQRTVAFFEAMRPPEADAPFDWGDMGRSQQQAAPSASSSDSMVASGSKSTVDTSPKKKKEDEKTQLNVSQSAAATDQSDQQVDGASDACEILVPSDQNPNQSPGSGSSGQSDK